LDWIGGIEFKANRKRKERKQRERKEEKKKRRKEEKKKRSKEKGMEGLSKQI
jgi:hypothetical protein